MHIGAPQEKDRLAALEHNVKVLDERLRDRTAEVDEGVPKLAKDLESVRRASTGASMSARNASGPGYGAA
jgi:hypothetical protein